MITPEDDFLHKRSDDPFWNESSWYSFSVPERRLQGWVYYFHRPNMGYTVGGVAAWDPSGDQHYDCVYYDWGQPYPMPPGAEKIDFTLPCGLTVKCIEPLKSFEFRYRNDTWYAGQGCELDLTWTAFVEPHDTGFPAGVDEWGVNGHFEQPGRMQGTVVLNGERIEVDCFSERDRSWGMRRPRRNPRGHFPWAIASEQSAFQLVSVSDLDPSEDPLYGTTEKVISGWYLKDGIYGTINSGECATVDRGAQGRPLRQRVKATDHLGRTLVAEGTAQNALAWHGYPWLMLWWVQFQWDLDGQTALGEDQEFFPLQHYRNVMRARAARPELSASTAG